MSEITNYPDAPDIESSTLGYQKRFSGKVGKWFLDVQSDATESIILKFEKKKCLNIVDIGGGHGQNIKTILEMGHKLSILGSNISCSVLIKDYIDNQSIQFIEGNLLDFPFKDNSFDVVLSYRILAHLKDWKVHIKELTRISNGLVIVDFPTIRSINYFSGSFFGLKKRIEKNTRHYQLFSEKEVVDEFSKYNFIPFYKIGQFVMPMALHRAIKQKKISVFLEYLSKISGLNHFFSSPLIYGFKKK